jgi:hypothetical protein
MVNATWKAIETASLWLWHNVLDPMWHGIVAGAEWVYQYGIYPLWTSLKTAFGWIESAASWLWHNVFDPLWHGIESGASDFIQAFKMTWNLLESIFKNPVSFLVNTVYDNGIARLWNDVVGALGMKSLELPKITGFARGGVVPGYAPGHDTYPAMLSPGEGVLVPEAVNAIGGPGTVLALNSEHGRGRTSSAGHYAGGGIFGWAEGILGKGWKLADLVGDLATGDTKSLTKDLDSFVSAKGALGSWAQVLLGVPKKLIDEAANYIAGIFGSKGASVSPGAVSGTVSQWFAQAVKLTGVPAAWIPDLETIGHYESGDNPAAINLSDSNAKAGDPSRGIMQTIMSTFLSYHQPGTSMNIFDPVANISAAINYIKARYHEVGNVPGIRSLAHGGAYVGYDQGGWLMPGNMPVNGLSRPEAVLTPDESQAFVTIARRLIAEGVGGGGLGGGHRQATINFYGTQLPTTEQKANMMRELALALGGAS